MELAIKQNCENKTFSLDVLKNSEKFHEWIDPNDVVMVHDIHHDSALDYATYIVITKDKIGVGDDLNHVTYSLYRFFMIGDTVHVSADHLGKTANYLFVELVGKNYSRGAY